MKTSFEFTKEEVQTILEDYIEKSGQVLPEITEMQISYTDYDRSYIEYFRIVETVFKPA